VKKEPSSWGKPILKGRRQILERHNKKKKNHKHQRRRTGIEAERLFGSKSGGCTRVHRLIKKEESTRDFATPADKKKGAKQTQKEGEVGERKKKRMSKYL